MTDEDLIGYTLDALSPEARNAIAFELRTNHAAAARLSQLRRLLNPLEADGEPPPPPPGLALRTVARVAAHLAEQEPCRESPSDLGTIVTIAAEMEAAEPEEHPLAFPAPMFPLRRAPRVEPETRFVGGRFRLDVLVACGIAFFACGLVFSGIGNLRARHQVLACQANLRTLHAGLAGYADTHAGRYPQIGTGDAPTAGTFASTLVDAGQVPVGFRPCCPADSFAVTEANRSPSIASPSVGYTYTLGYRTPAGDLLGFRRGDRGGEHDLVPVSADYPTAAAAPAAGPLCPHNAAMNVLCAGGNVRRTTSALVGPDGDDIYRNFHGRVAAGTHHADVVLGRPGDRP